MLECSHLQKPALQCPHSPFPRGHLSGKLPYSISHVGDECQKHLSRLAGPRMGSSKSKYQPLLGDPGHQQCVCPGTLQLPAVTGGRPLWPSLHDVPGLQELYAGTTSFPAPHSLFQEALTTVHCCSLQCSGVDTLPWGQRARSRKPSRQNRSMFISRLVIRQRGRGMEG